MMGVIVSYSDNEMTDSEACRSAVQRPLPSGRLLSEGVYATFSSRFIIRNMNAAERRQRTMNTDQTTVRDKPPQR